MIPLSPSARLRRDLILELLAPLPADADVLEVGIGAGATTAELGRRWKVTGLDLDDHAITLARRRFESDGLRATLFRGCVEDLPPEARFDAVCAFEVLEHQPDDVATLRRWRRTLRPRGAVVLSVPAHPERFGASDSFVGHVRRYSRESLGDSLRAAGFEPDVIWCYGFPLLNVLEHVRNAVARRRLRRATRETSAAARSRASGYALQPPSWLATAIGPAVDLSAVVQRRFLDTDRGTGFVARAWNPT